jgi:tetratricopeptide (TPR) repeat protein
MVIRSATATSPSVSDRLATGASEREVALQAVNRGDWRQLAAVGRFALASQTLRLLGGEDAERYVPILSDLHAIERHVQRKEYAAALARSEALGDPGDLLDASAMVADLQQLKVAGDAIERRDFEAARAALAALQTDHFTAERATLEGTLAVLEGEPVVATAHFDRALERDSQHIRALTNRGNIKLEAGDVDGAIADYEAALKVDDSFANAHHNLGVAYRRQGKISKSVASLRRAQRSSLRQDTDALRQERKLRRSASTSPNRYRWLWWGAVVAIGLWFARQQGIF